MSRRDDLTASVAVVAFLTQLIFAQVTLALVVFLLIAGKVGRWRPAWLAVPATAGAAWLLVVGVRPATAGYLAVGSRLLGVLARRDALGAKAEGVTGLLVGWRRWLPGQLPFALVVATAQTALLSLPGRKAPKRPYRRGALVVARSWYLTATLRRGELATYDGCCLGVIASTGRRAAVSWQEAEAGVLCAGQDAAAVSATGADLALAAIQHRKTVVIIDLVGDADFVESECTAVAAPLRRLGRRGDQGAHYDPLSGASPARATSLTMAMVDWTAVPHASHLFCANYLNVVFTVLAGRASERTTGATLDELVRLMAPRALRASLAQLSGRTLAAGSLAVRVAELTRQLEADPAVLAPVAAKLAELSSAALAQLIRPAADEASISVAAALAGREVALFSLDRLVLGEPAAMVARLVVADLIETLAERSDLGSRADCLVWVNGCEAIGHRQLTALVALGERTGTSVVLGTALSSAGARIAADVNVVVVRGTLPAPIHDEMADAVAQFHAPGCGDALSFTVRRPTPRLVAGCKAL